MRTSLAGIKKIALREGTILHVYKDSKGLLTAGVGHLIKPEEKADYPYRKKITQAESDAWLTNDLRECEDAVNSLGVNLKQNEFDALVSLAFNIGVGGFKRSTVARRLKAGDKKGAAEAILMWNKPPEIQGRRRTEYTQFLTPYKPLAAASATPTPLTPTPTEPVETSIAPTETPSQPIATETKVTETVEKQDTTVTQEQTVTTPKGDAPEVTPTKVTKNGPLSHYLFTGGGIMTLGTMLWGFIQSNLNAVAVGMICLTVLILAIIYRKALTDAIRMQVAADPDKKNVT